MIEIRHGRLQAAGVFDAVLVTSRNAVPALPEGLRGTVVLAVGKATAARAVAAGFGTVRNADGDAAELAALARRDLRAGARVLVAHARGQGAGLIAALREGGFRVQARVAYEVRAVRRWPEAAEAAVAGGGLRAALFLSGETARAFVRLLPAGLSPHLSAVDALAIGPVAGEALSPLPWRRVRVSVRPTLDHVLAMI